jgi:hypothetical protein
MEIFYLSPVNLFMLLLIIIGILATASPIIIKLCCTACTVFISAWYISKLRSLVKLRMFSMESLISANNKGMLRSDMYQAFFYIRKIFGPYSFAGYEVNFCMKNIFQFICESNKIYPNSVVKIHKIIDIAFFIKITTGLTAEQSHLRNWISLLRIRFTLF